MCVTVVSCDFLVVRLCMICRNAVLGMLCPAVCTVYSHRTHDEGELSLLFTTCGCCVVGLPTPQLGRLMEMK